MYKYLPTCLVIATVIIYGGFVMPVLALTISPVKIDIEADPGQTVSGVFELHNEEIIPRTLYASFENFEPSGDLGTPRFIGQKEGLATWLSATEEIVVTPDQRITVPFTIRVPLDAKPGGYFAAIFYGGQNPNTGVAGEIAIGGKLGVLLLLRVKGDITEEGGINTFETLNNERLFTGIPVTFVTKMTNRGGDRIVPQGGITVRNIVGMEVTRLEVNTGQGSILPNSSRTFTQLWSGSSPATTTNFMGSLRKQWVDFHVGVYNAQAELVWGVDKNVSTASFWFILFPWQLLLVMSGLLVVAGVILRTYNRYIIARSKK